MSPAALHQPDLRIHHHIGNCLEQKIFLGNEVRVKNCEEFPFGDFHAGLERSRLEIFSVCSVDELDVVAFRLLLRDFPLGDFVAFVRGIVEHLDFVLVLRVVDGAHGIDQAFHAVRFVEDGELGRDHGKLVHLVVPVKLQQVLAVGKAHPAAVFQEKVDAPIAIETIDDKTDSGDDVNDKKNIQKILSHVKTFAFLMLAAKYRNAMGILLYSD